MRDTSDSGFTDQAVTFDCRGECLVGIVSKPTGPLSRAVLIVVGGPQYRVGSHRQFALLARRLSAEGIAAMRFDYRGMGDSSGDSRTFEEIHDDLRAAIDAFVRCLPDIREIVLWGLCDAVSAILLYARWDARVAGLILLNPFVYTIESQARTYVKHYYWQRLRQWDYWRKVFSGRFNVRSSMRSLAGLAIDAFVPWRRKSEEGVSLPERMRLGLKAYRGQVIIILSGADLVAREFKDAVGRSEEWQRLLKSPHVLTHEFPGVNHTFSRREWRDQAASLCISWLKSW
jgi:uncharacterized protein